MSCSDLVRFSPEKCPVKSNLYALLKPHAAIIIFTGTWLHSTDKNLSGAPRYRALFCSNDNYRSGGVAVFVREDLVAHKISVETVACDVLMVEILVGSLKLNLVAIYRSPTRAVPDVGNFITSELRDILLGLRKELKSN